MVLNQRGRRGVSECTPRWSGDGPFYVTQRGLELLYAPQERGWSIRRRMREREEIVRPAGAGMVPCPDGCSKIYWRTPRTLGDGPSAWS